MSLRLVRFSREGKQLKECCIRYKIKRQIILKDGKIPLKYHTCYFIKDINTK